jgi:hypothetical protein
MNHMTVSAQPRRCGRPRNTSPKPYITVRDGAFQCAARYPLNRKVYLGTYHTRQEALTAFLRYAETGEIPRRSPAPKREMRVRRKKAYATAADWKRVYEKRVAPAFPAEEA